MNEKRKKMLENESEFVVTGFKYKYLSYHCYKIWKFTQRFLNEKKKGKKNRKVISKSNIHQAPFQNR